MVYSDDGVNRRENSERGKWGKDNDEGTGCVCVRRKKRKSSKEMVIVRRQEISDTIKWRRCWYIKGRKP